jgi:prepilin-type N-terminal cleavage/methylation domain-containing protein
LKTKYKKAFTLLELLITVSLAGILLFLALYSFDTMVKEQNLQIATKQIASAYDTAKYIAQKSGVQTNVILTQNTGTYSIKTDNATITNDLIYGSTSGELPDTVKILSNNCGSIGFDVNGMLVSGNSPSSDCNISIGYSNGSTKDLTLKIATGSIDE